MYIEEQNRGMSESLHSYTRPNNIVSGEDLGGTSAAIQEQYVPDISLETYIVGEAKRIVDENMAFARDFIVEEIPFGRLVFHKSFLNISLGFCTEHADMLGLTDTSEASIRTYMANLYGEYLAACKREQRWSRSILDMAVRNLSLQGLVSESEVTLIATLVADQDRDVADSDTLICLPSPYDDLSFYKGIGVSLENWQKETPPYTKKDSRGLIIASSKYPTDFT